MANALLYVAELCASVKYHAIPLLPRFMPAIIQVTTDLSLLARFLLIAVLCTGSEMYHYYCNHFMALWTLFGTNFAKKIVFV